MAVARVQGKQDYDIAGTRSGTTYTISPTGAFTANDGAVMGIFWKGAVTISSVADTAGNTWADCGAGKITRPVDGFLQLYGCAKVAAGTPAITVTWSGTATEFGADLEEYSGQDQTTLFDSVTGSGTATSGTAVTCGSFTPTITNGAIYEFCCTDDTTASASGTGMSTLRADGAGDGSADRIFTSSVGAVTPGFTLSATITKGAVLAAVIRAAATTSTGWGQPIAGVRNYHVLRM